MSEYIYRPPPPPPSAPSSALTPSRGGHNNGQRGGFQGGRGDRVGGRAGGRGGSLGNRGRGRGGGRGGGGGRGNPNYQMTAMSQTPQNYGRQQQQQRIPHPLPQFPPQTHINPTFLAQRQAITCLLAQQAFTGELPTTTPVNPPAPSFPDFPNISPRNLPQWQPPILGLLNPYLSYSQEQYNAQPPPVQQPQPVPQNDSYTEAPSGWPSHSSYGYFEPPKVAVSPRPVPQPRKQRGDDKPDMDEATWLSLNGGKLIGTNIAPPETPEEIEAWIKERKSRFPTARKIAEDQGKKETEKEAREAAWGAQAQAQETALKSAPTSSSPTDSKKRKRPTADDGDAPDVATDTNSSSSDSDSEAPEAVSTKSKSTLPDAVTTGRKYEPKPRKQTVCKYFATRGRCHRGDGCKFLHEVREGPPKRKEKKKKMEEGRKTLYQRLVEHDREKENTMMLQVIKYLIDKGKLKEEVPKKQEG